MSHSSANPSSPSLRAITPRDEKLQPSCHVVAQPDLAGAALPKVITPTRLIVGGFDCQSSR